MAKRTLEQLNLLDDFLFGTMVNYPGIGEKFIRELFKIIFQREFGKLVVIPQKVYYGMNTNKHGARLDVYLEEPKEGVPGGATVYDVDPDQNDDEESQTALPRRVRFYHAKIDAASLKSGESYHSLKNVIVIMIIPYDPFGKNRMVYTIRNKCEEMPDMAYDDGALTLYLYTRGTEGNPPIELRQLLHYMEDTTEENAKNPALQGIQQMVQTVKRDGEVSLEYMKIFEREEMLIRRGRKEGREEGLEEGRKAEQANTERERQRAIAAENEVARLKEELRKLQKS